MKLGVLALQGAFREHLETLDAIGIDTVPVRSDDELAAVDALVLPGGESTAIGRLLRTSGLVAPLSERIGAGLPVLATCAGLILLAERVQDGRPDQVTLGALDITVRRNGYGRQQASFEAPLPVTGLSGGPFPGVFIRAPRIESVGPGVHVLAELGQNPVLIRQGVIWGAVFHPELSGDLRLHQAFLAAAADRSPGTAYDPGAQNSRKGDA
jgi:5'-phosphate synthase pdxT subunit